MNIFERLQYIDRRIMYALLMVAIAVPLIWRINLPVVVTPAVKGVYDTFDKMPSDKIALIVVYWELEQSLKRARNLRDDAATFHAKQKICSTSVRPPRKQASNR